MTEQPSRVEQTPEQQAKWQKFVDSAFQAADLPEVPEEQLEVGTYTNAQIAEKLQGDPMKLLSLLMGVSTMGGHAEKRSILSFAVDAVDMAKEEQE